MLKKFYSLFLLLAVTLTAAAAGPSGSLPVLHINTANGAPIESKETYLNGTYWLDPNGAAGVEAFGSESAPLALQIRGRGNYTWTGFEKKPYRLKLDKKAALLGMNSNKHWALLAHADDNRAFLRNATGFQLSRMIGLPWTPGDVPCEVVLNGDYIGLYFLTETVRVDKKRVNVTNTDDEVEDWLAANPDKTAADYQYTPLQLTGGWLCEIDNYDDADQVKVSTRQSSNEVLRITYDTPSDFITEAHKNWLRNEFSTIDNMLFDGNKAWMDKIDITDLAKFFVVNQITGNYESFHGSCKLWREQGENEKWHFGPVWDFGSAFQPSRDMATWIWDSYHFQHWIEKMYSYSEFADEVKRVYSEFAAADLNDIYDFQTQFVNNLKSAAAADYQRWGSKGYGNSNMDRALSEVQAQLTTSINFLNDEFIHDVPIVDGPDDNIYLRGQINGWRADNNYRFTHRGDGVYTLVVKNLNGEFKIANSRDDWAGNVDYGFDGSIPFDTPVELVYQGRNTRLGDESKPELTLIFNWNNKTLTASTTGYSGVESLPEVDGETPVYFNLQGMKVENPSGGIYIRVSNGKSTKVLMK